MNILEDFYHTLRFIHIDLKYSVDEYYNNIVNFFYDGSVRQTKEYYQTIINNPNYYQKIIHGEIFITDQDNNSKVIESHFNKKLTEIVDQIIQESLIRQIFIPVGYSNKGGHIVSLQKAPSSKTQKRYPQCILKFNKPDTSTLKDLLIDLLIINRSYENTSIKYLYERLFSIHQTFSKQPIDVFNDSMIKIIKKIFLKYINISCIEHTGIIFPQNIPLPIDNIVPVLKHHEYHKMETHRIKFSENVNTHINQYMSQIFTSIYLDKFLSLLFHGDISDHTYDTDIDHYNKKIKRFKTIDIIHRNRKHIKNYYEHYCIYKLSSIAPGNFSTPIVENSFVYLR